MTHAVVMKLVDPIKGRGHHVYMDNYYTSPQLFSNLHDNGFGACGTVRINRRGLPAALKENVRKGEMKVIQMDNSMLAIKWMDKRAVTALTTIHDNTSVAVERRNRHAAGGWETVMKPQVIVEYNRYMGGVDHADQLLSYYGFGHRTVKWWRRAFFFLLDMAVVNSYILYTLQNPDKRRRLSHEQFRVTLATDLLHVAALSGLLRHVHAAQCVHQTTPNMRSTGSTELTRFQVAGKLANCVRSTTSNSHSCGLRTSLRAKKR